MKFVDNIIEKAMETSSHFKALKEYADLSTKSVENRIKIEINEAKMKMNQSLIDTLEYVSKVHDQLEFVLKSIDNVVTTLEMHQKAITDLYAAVNAVTAVLNDKRSTTVDLPEIKKAKNEKPN